MQKIIDPLSENIHAHYLQTINGIKFTKREIDIMACLCQAKSNKGIAKFLSEGSVEVTESAVHSHNNNIKRKLGCCSKEDIAAFVEKTGKRQVINDYYLSLILHKEFRSMIGAVPTIMQRCVEEVTIISYKSSDQNVTENSSIQVPDTLLIKYLHDYLGLLEIKTSIKTSQDFIGTVSSKAESADKHHIIHVLPPTNNEHQHLLNRANSIFLIPNIADYSALLNQIRNAEYITLEEVPNFFTLFFEILKKLVVCNVHGKQLQASTEDKLRLEKIIAEFSDKYSNIYGSKRLPESSAIYPRITDIAGATNSQKLHLAQKINLTKQSWTFYMMIFLAFLVTCICVAWFLTGNKFNRNAQTFVHSDLVIPESSTLLRRSNITKFMDEKLNSDKGINIVALVGGGGLGKTTLARLYASDKNMPIIWELNAETSHSLMSSFELLAYAICETRDEKQELNSIQETTDANQKEKLLLLFVQNKLRKHDNWLLIYDNVESFEHIRKFFPYDAKAWGKGKALITTRNSNISVNSYIPPKNVITIAELLEPEKFELFCNITGSCIVDKERNEESPQNDGVRAFLARLPSFPLDISTAAYYIKESGISYTEYIKSIDSMDPKFTSLQENILKDASEYSKTRYEIITLSIKRIMEMNPEYKDLLLFSSLINSQNIPTDLLGTYRDNNLVTNFIRELKRVSFITTTASTTSNKVRTFSIHRSTQAIMLTYLAQYLNLSTTKGLLVPISDTLEKYMSRELVKYYPEEIELFVGHAESFLDHKNLLTEELQANIDIQLGKYYFFLGNFDMAKKIGERGFLTYSKLFGPNSPKVGRSLVLLGDIYRENGNYEEAEKLISESYNTYKSNYGESNIDTIRARLHLAIIYKHLGLYSKAKEILEETIRPYKDHYGENHIKIASVLVNLGAVYKHMGFFKEAIAPLEEGLVIYKNNLGDDHVKVAWALTILGDVYKSNGMYEKAESVCNQSYNIYKNHYGEHHIKIAWTLVNLSEVYKDTQSYSKAAKILESALAVYKKHYGAEHNKTARAIRDLGEVYLRSGNFTKAEQLLVSALNISQKANHPDQFKCLELLSDLYLAQSKEAKSFDQKTAYEAKTQEYLTQSVQVARELLPPDAPHLKRVEDKLAEFLGGK
ncbi:MAG: tetratricopeptide repeat protein [Pseudomonadota bacterium]